MVGLSLEKNISNRVSDEVKNMLVLYASLDKKNRQLALCILKAIKEPELY